jgi:hypothetical protein
LEAVIQELQRVVANPQTQDVQVEASHSAGTHEFKIVIKEKPMVAKANEVAVTPVTEPQAAAASARKLWVKSAGWERLASGDKKSVASGFPSEFLAAMGIK